MRINHNIAALNTYNKLSANNASTSKSLEKLSSGLKINRAGDDAAGLAISEKMRGQIRGLDTASRNANDGISMLQTAEGAMNESQSILQRMRELAVQSSNDTNTNSDRTEIQKEVDALRTEFDRIAKQTEFNTQKLLDGSMSTKLNSNTATSTLLDDTAFDSMSYTGLAAGTWTLAAQADHSYILSNGTGINLSSTIPAAATAGAIQFGGPNGESVTINVNNSYAADGLSGSAFAITGSQIQLQIGANTNQSMAVEIADMRITGGGTEATITALAGVDVSSQAGANTAIATIDAALKTVSSSRADLGAYQNRLEHTINNLGTSSENLTAAESRIRDVDMAKEMMEFTKNNILSQAAQAMLAQANQQPQGVLQLLQ